MSMYDMVSGGPHPMAGTWLVRVLGVDPRQINRFRNAYIVDSEEDGELIIYVLTRSEDNPVLKLHPKHLRDRRAHLGDTYWEFEFKLPEELHEEVKELGPIARLPRFAEHFEQMLNRLQNQNDPVTEEMLKRAKPFFESLERKLKEGGGIIEV